MTQTSADTVGKSEDVVIGWGTIEAPPTELHVNKPTLSMRRRNNGGLSFPPGLMMSVLLLYYLLWKKKRKKLASACVSSCLALANYFVLWKLGVTLKFGRKKLTVSNKPCLLVDLAESGGSCQIRVRYTHSGFPISSHIILFDRRTCIVYTC